MSHRPVVLAIDDEPKILGLLTRLLEPEFSIDVAASGPEGLAKADAIAPELILLDLRMPQMSGIAVLRRLRETGKHIPVIVVTAYGGVPSAVQAIKLGATDYIEKPFEEERLKEAMRACLAGRKRIEDLASMQGIIGESPQMQRAWRWVEQYGPTDLPILLYGETGTGKELFAKAIHEISKRRRGPFVPVDVSTAPETLMESEIFGYERGAFTGASKNKSGRLEWANRGTLFLDEIENLTLPFQVKLLRVLQEERYVPVGGREIKSLDARVVSATNTDLRQAIQDGTFREDLYYRINGVTIELPPLREREGDTESLVHHFVEKYGRKYNKFPLELSDEAIEQLLSYKWPGNVRELEHTIAGAVVLADGVILPEHLSLSCLAEVSAAKLGPTDCECLIGSSPLGCGSGKEIVLDLNFRCDLARGIDLKKLKERVAAQTERFVISEAKKRLHLKQTELAAFLGIDPKTLRGKLKQRVSR